MILKKALLIITLLVLSNVMFAQVIEEEIIEEEIIEEEILEEENIDSSEIIESEDIEPEKASKISSETSGNIRGDYRYFPKPGLYPGQKQEYFSAVFNPEIYLEWGNGNQLVQFKGFARLSQHDDKQTHWDIRELYYQRVFNKWEFSLGAKVIYWGFTESNHLVNIINQDDVLEGSDIENKLGQPMIHLSTTRKWGTIDFMVMSYFRELQFPGPNGRLRPPFNISEDATYESNQEEYNPDFAIRWSHSIKSVDIGISHFYGTSRLPLFGPSSTNTLEPVFVPYYELINQTGLELQATTGSMLWKLEAIYRNSERKTIKAFTAGGEYTFSNVFKSDVGLLAEYNYDDRPIEESLNGLTNDVFLGMRIALNDKQSTDFLGGANYDLDDGTIQYFAEANRRIGDSWKITISALGFSNVAPSQFIYLIREDGFIQFSLAKYF